LDIGQRKKYLIEKLKNEEYRKAYVSEHIDTGIPFQIRALRKQREWGQQELGDRVDKQQEQISRLENPNYASFTLSTLKELASAFEVGLMVRFVPISDLVKWDLELTSESLKAVSFDEDVYFEDKPDEIDASQGVARIPLNTTTGDLSGTVSPPLLPPPLMLLHRDILDNQTAMQVNS
jgi:transcriptional regulator with XRE-family HTH domain